MPNQLPELSAASRRKLDLRWSKLLDQHGLTGEHLVWHDYERERRKHIAAQEGPRKGRSWAASSSGWAEENAVDEVGISQSVDLAEAFFNDLAHEYWRHWISQDVGYEIFEGWLPTLQHQILDKLETIWKDKGTDLWYERACGPALERALADRAKQWIRRARDHELETPTAQASEPHQEPVPTGIDGAKESAPPKELEDVEIKLTGKTMRTASNEVIVSGKAVSVGNRPFLLLLALVIERLGSSEGWITTQELMTRKIISEDSSHKDVKRLRDGFASVASVGDPKQIVVSPGDGKVRLAVEPENLHFDKHALSQHDNAAIREVAGQLPDR